MPTINTIYIYIYIEFSFFCIFHFPLGLSFDLKDIANVKDNVQTQLKVYANYFATLHVFISLPCTFTL